jgi:F0F1-type ATP synthase epsilon subunit
MKLTINTPNHTTHYSIAWLEINTPTGNYIIQQGHAPMILSLSYRQPMIFRLKTGKQETLIVHHGIAKIDRVSATIVMTTIEG